MDNKLVAALVIAVIGVGTGIAGIVIANDAKDQNEKTQAALKAAVATENQGLAQQEAKASKQVTKEAATAEQEIKAEAQKSAGDLSSIQSSVDSLQSQLSNFQSAQKQTNQSINNRISALAQRVDSMGG